MNILSSEIHMQNKSFTQNKVKLETNMFSSFQASLKNLNQINEEKSNKVLKEVLNNEADLSIKDYVQKFLVEIILETFLKKKIKLQPEEYIEDKNISDLKPKTLKKENKNSLNHNINEIKSSFIYQSSYEYYKKSTIDFSSSINIKTKDKDININLDISFTQEFYEKHKKRISFNQAISFDPLVISHSSNAFDSISDMSFEFDLNNDGKMDLIPLLKNASFLAIDKNNNKKIDNGSELFGPSTNNAFEELREYDKDKNDFIDENDDIYKNLLVWSKNEKGENTLISLAAADIGAIYLNDISSSFVYKKDIRTSIAQLESTSIFLNNEGTKAGLISALNFKV